MGKSGTGKSYSMRNLDPKTTYLIGAVKKILPWKGGRADYSIEKKNVFYTMNYMQIFDYIHRINLNAPHIKNIVIDDSQYLMGGEFMGRALETGFTKFTEIGKKYYDLIMFCKEMRDDLNIFFLTHTEEDEQKHTKMKTIGKMLDDKICLEGLFTVILETQVSDGEYKFMTQNNGRNTARSPHEMFSGSLIDNDLAQVDKAMRDY
jgi:hypothetical protein